MWGDMDKMTWIGHWVTLIAVFAIIITLLAGLIRGMVNRRREQTTIPPWQQRAPAERAPSPAESSQLESMRQTLGLPPKADEEKQREHARRVLAKGRVRRFFGK
jgi:flagellar biosynthesis/type III secretory pathway M-ring protein FliF/YscJ